MAKNGFLQKQQDAKNNVMHIAERLTEQYMEDTLEIAMKRAGYGFDRIDRMLQLWVEVRREYKPALDHKDPEADVAQDHMDGELSQILKDKRPLIPFYDRYPELKRVSYEVRRCGKK